MTMPVDFYNPNDPNISNEGYDLKRLTENPTGQEKADFKSWLTNEVGWLKANYLLSVLSGKAAEGEQQKYLTEWVTEGMPSGTTTTKTTAPTTTPSDVDYDAYVASGGKLSYEDWLAGKKDTFGGDYTPPEKPPDVQGYTTVPQYNEAGVIVGWSYIDSDELTPQQKADLEFETWVRQQEYLKGDKKLDDPLKPPEAPEGHEPYWDGDQWVIRKIDPSKAPDYISPVDQASIDLQRQQMEQQGQYQQAQLSWQQQQAQMQQQEQERQYKAQLAANPMSWLEYSAYTNQQPVVQPWMMPLSSKDYGWQVGQPLGGWNKEGGDLQNLTTPSSQMWARMGPTAQQQYAGYEQWDTGQRPEETAYRLASQSAPRGQYSQLQWLK